MVYYSIQADFDLDEILDGLLNWERISLTRDFCHHYIADIIDVCESLDMKTFHADAKYESHKRHGVYAYPYKRNSNTTWYIIYDIDLSGNILIKKIISNYQTIR